MTGPRDWDKELADIDRLIAKQPASPPAKTGPAAPAARAQAPALAPARGPSGLAVWIRVGLGAVLAVGMTQWPYAHSCGLALLLYAGAIGVVGLVGLWGAVAAWRRRMGLAHVLALGVVLWGLILAGTILLPRIGYASETAGWLCR